MVSMPGNYELLFCNQFIDKRALCAAQNNAQFRAFKSGRVTVSNRRNLRVVTALFIVPYY